MGMRIGVQELLNAITRLGSKKSPFNKYESCFLFLFPNICITKKKFILTLFLNEKRQPYYCLNPILFFDVHGKWVKKSILALHCDKTCLSLFKRLMHVFIVHVFCLLFFFFSFSVVYSFSSFELFFHFRPDVGLLFEK